MMYVGLTAEGDLVLIKLVVEDESLLQSLNIVEFVKLDDNEKIKRAKTPYEFARLNVPELAKKAKQVNKDGNRTQG